MMTLKVVRCSRFGDTVQHQAIQSKWPRLAKRLAGPPSSMGYGNRAALLLYKYRESLKDNMQYLQWDDDLLTWSTSNLALGGHERFFAI